MLPIQFQRIKTEDTTTLQKLSGCYFNAWENSARNYRIVNIELREG